MYLRTYALPGQQKQLEILEAELNITACIVMLSTYVYNRGIAHAFCFFCTHDSPDLYACSVLSRS